MTIDFSKNPKQAEFLNAVLMAASGKTPVRQIMLGGGIRSGKSFAMLGALCVLAAAYPGSRTVIYRKSFVALQDTTIPSMEKLLAGTTTWKWNRSPSNYYCEHLPTGSRIFFSGENIAADPQLNAILGLEMNFCCLEQCEELSEDLYKKIQSRLGSYYLLPNMPKPLMLCTTNPTQIWVKDVFYSPWRENVLPEHKMYISMNPVDNTFLTDDQREIFNQLDERTKRQFIEGDWTDLRSTDDLFAWSFKRDKHVAKSTMDPLWAGDNNHYLYLSFDFNVNPISCAVIQHIDSTIYVLEQIKLANSNIYELCNVIKAKYPNFMYLVTGDASGKNTQAMVKDNLNYYRIIATELGIGQQQFKIPSVNPLLVENAVLVNSILSRYSVQMHPEKAKSLIWDLENVRVNADGSIIKANRNNPAEQSDALDCFRYYLNTYHRQFVKLKTVE